MEIEHGTYCTVINQVMQNVNLETILEKLRSKVIDFRKCSS